MAKLPNSKVLLTSNRSDRLQYSQPAGSVTVAHNRFESSQTGRDASMLTDLARAIAGLPVQGAQIWTLT